MTANSTGERRRQRRASEYSLNGDDMMKKVLIVVLGLLLALAGAGLAASPATAG